MIMTHTVVKIAVIESERDWGRKVDDWMVCLTAEDAKKFEKEFNSKNTELVAPDWYMQVEGDPKPIDLTDSQYEALNHSKNGRMWLSSLNKIV